ncbi:MAG: hypothetical protein K2M36_01500 [Clostridia bacterium]|nr:hypothetical protein [Clostridia bacterium]
MSKESIVQKILSDAEIRANSFIEEQTAKADEILTEVDKQCEKYRSSFRKETDRMVFDHEARSKSVAELEVRKLMLAAKAKLLDGVFERAAELLKALDGDTQKKLLLGMLGAAEDGDVITLGKAQKDLLSKQDIEEYAKEKGIHLSLSENFGDFDGMVISGKGVDKNLTFDVEIALLREEVETQIAKELFD